MDVEPVVEQEPIEAELVLAKDPSVADPVEEEEQMEGAIPINIKNKLKESMQVN